jgi:hypothetical protein
VTAATLPPVVRDNAWFRENARPLSKIRALKVKGGIPMVTEAGMKVLLGDATADDGKVHKPRGHMPYRPGDHKSEYAQKVAYLNALTAGGGSGSDE